MAVTKPSAELPEFSMPPLNEVVLGIQFQPPKNYQQIFAYEVWQLFRAGFPTVQEQPPLAPVFETFGLPQVQQIPFSFVTGAAHDRFWFLEETGAQLLQFQPDRLLHNWRKVGTGTNEYPRFEAIIVQFEREISLLQEYFRSRGNERLMINQCEISYINHIPIGALTTTFYPQDWFSFLTPDHPAVDELNYAIRTILKDEEGRAFGRLHRESAISADAAGRKILTLNLTVRGKPPSDTDAAALEFIKRGRYMIAEEFIRITTTAAHEKWGRTK
ncbi:uncharacterized protein (TIGR04255 family) [Afipia massiliensis]|uniref:Uncharacterized protein (TIGR04255 family) n=1 Tax=Afipia massiliensis TaxID=211460 RepID=A0A840N1B5_9BRAD|nr:TIGR04255 family protein [Afipia massiliensis]MBB5050526.1 uncharacterized protein (TIGR04255 family) [Afipia massiliensis]